MAFAALILFVIAASFVSSLFKGNKLEDSYALTYCDNLAKDNADYGWQKSLGDTSFEHNGDNIEVIFRNAKLGNALGGQRQVNIKCVVNGTKDDINLVSFDSF
jgi:hypothetical protein